jgi:acyl carrier protein
VGNVTREQVISIMKSAELDANLSELDPAIDLRKQGVDSLDMMSALLAIQEEFDIDISDEEMSSGGWSTIDAIVSSLNARL